MSAANIAFGCWTVLSPWVFRYYATDTTHLWFSIVIGAAVMAFGARSGTMTLDSRRERPA